MLKLPQILGWRPVTRGRHERPTAELPEETFRPEEIDAAIEALALPEDLEEVLTDSPSQGSEETREQAETTAEEEAPRRRRPPRRAGRSRRDRPTFWPAASSGRIGSRSRPWRPCSGPGSRAIGRPSTCAAGSTSSGSRTRAGRGWP